MIRYFIAGCGCGLVGTSLAQAIGLCLIAAAIMLVIEKDK